MKIAVVGTGYVGLVSGACFADYGIKVICADIDANKIAKLNNGEIPIYEPGLDDFVARGTKKGLLSFTTDIEAACKNVDVVLIAVGTPPAADGSADLKYIFAAAKTIGQSISNNTIVVIRSTVPVGTTEAVEKIIAANTKVSFDVAFCPEFLKEGAAIADFIKPDRVVIGTNNNNNQTLLTLSELYAPACVHRDCLIFMDIRSAELTKYASNAMLATRISFMNEMALLCEKYGADIEQVRMGMSLDQRIGSRFLFAGIGFGGSCFLKDLLAAAEMGKNVGIELKIINSVISVNERQKELLANKIITHFGNVDGKIIGLLGLSFKPGTDDIRDAASLIIINKLLDNGAKIRAYDPVAMPAIKKLYGDRIELCSDLYEVCINANCLALLTEWHEFQRPDFSKIKELLVDKVIFDGRNTWDGAKLRALGFTYYGIGKK